MERRRRVGAGESCCGCVDVYVERAGGLVLYIEGGHIRHG
jgi:hypothetical protein